MDDLAQARRFALFWAMAITTYVVMSPDSFTDAKFVSAVGILSAITLFYGVHRSKGDQ